MMKKTYGITIKARTGTVKPVVMTFSSEEEKSRVVMDAAKRVMKTHAKVIKALANR